MSLLRLGRCMGIVWLPVIASASAGCVDPFGGSNIQITFASGVHTPGLPTEFGRPPPGTHYAFYAVTFTRDDTGVPVESTAFHLLDFEVQPVINRSSPCFIEDDESRFPGLHVTQYATKLEEEIAARTGTSDPFDPAMPHGDAVDILTARTRMDNLGRLAAAIKAVTTFSPAQLPRTDTVCANEGGSDPLLVPPPTCREDESSLRRRELCTQFWAANPGFYEGSDKVFTLPLNGRWRGAVTTNDPRNAAFIGGAGFFVDANLEDLDALLVNWQYDDLDGDGEPDYPADFPDADKSPLGFHYLVGTPVSKTRGVINVPLSNDLHSAINGEAAIWTDLDDDDVHF